MALMDIIKARHSIRKYTDQQIRRKDLEKILEAGNYAPNAGGGCFLHDGKYDFTGDRAWNRILYRVTWL